MDIKNVLDELEELRVRVKKLEVELDLLRCEVDTLRCEVVLLHPHFNTPRFNLEDDIHQHLKHSYKE